MGRKWRSVRDCVSGREWRSISIACQPKDSDMTEQTAQAPKCLSFPMRKPATVGMYGGDPLSDWILIPPGTPFEIRAWDNGRWTIRVGREQVAQGRVDVPEDGNGGQLAADAAGAVLTGWAMVLIPAIATEPVKLVQTPEQRRK